MAKKFIRKTKSEIEKQSDRLGEAKAAAASNDLSRQVLEVSARSKQQIHERALAESLGRASREHINISDVKSFERWIQPLKVRLMRELISPGEALKELRALAGDERCAVKVRAYILEQLDSSVRNRKRAGRLRR